MKEHIKDKWIAALLSGEYKQGRTRLKTQDGGFCCLGVLCDLASEEGVGTWKGLNFQSDNFNMPWTSWLPPEVVDWAGMRSINGELPFPVNLTPGKEAQSLISINDHQTSSFEQIAFAIEGCWEEL